MVCFHCKQSGELKGYEIRLYFGTVSYSSKNAGGSGGSYEYFHPKCYREWWDDLTWHLDCIDERMNANKHFNRISGDKGTYKGQEVRASWNGLIARHILGDYEFEHRRPHPTGCTCDL